MIVRDLWAYQLAISPLPSVHEATSPTGYVNGMVTSPAPAQPFSNEEVQIDDDKSDDSASSKSSESSKSADDANIDPELLAELSEGSTDKEEQLREVSPDSGTDSDLRWRRKGRLRVSDTVVTLVVGLWVTRVPVLSVDIEK